MKKSGQKPSFGQGLELSVIIEKALASAVKKNGTDLEKIQKVIGKPGVIFDFFEKLLADNVEVKPSILKLISGRDKITIEALNGKEFIYDSNDVFKCYVDEDFKNWGINKPGPATTEIQVDVHEMAKDGTFKEIFTSISNDIEKLVLTQAQIKKFCQNYPNWLRQDEYSTFFLTKQGGEYFGEYFVVDVDVFFDGLNVGVSRFENSHVWDGEYRHRVVVPQLVSLDE